MKKEMKAECLRAICNPTFLAALFTVAEFWKQPKCLSVDEGSRKCGIYMIGISFGHGEEGNPAIGGNTEGSEGLVLSEVNQMEKDRHSLVSLTCRISSQAKHKSYKV